MRLFSALVLTATLAACADAPPPALAPETATEQDSVLALIRTADTDAFDAAYARLNGRTYQVTIQTVQLHQGGETQATHTRTFQVSPDTTTLVDADSAGEFDFGRFDAFADGRRILTDLGRSPAALVLDEEPAYLDPRGTEVFAYGLASDTTLGDRSVRTLTVTVRPDEDDQPLRSARLYLDASGALVGARLVRRQASILFKESSTTELFLQPAGEGWLPDRLTTESTIQAPLTDARRFRLTERYSFPD